MKDFNPEKREQLRNALLEALWIREGSALTTHKLYRLAAMEVDFAFDEGDTAAALAFLAGLDLVRMDLEPLGSTQYWRITPQGALKIERSQQPNRPPRHD